MSSTTGTIVFNEIPPGQLTIEAFFQNMMYGRVTADMPENDLTVTVQLVEGIRFFVFESFTANQATRTPISGVTVEIRQGQTVVATLTTGQNGIAGPILLTAGSYTVRFSRSGYVPKSQTLVVETNYQSTEVPIPLDRTLWVRVFGRNNQPLQGAVVSSGSISFTTDAQGNAYLNLPSGTHTVNVTPPANSGLESTSFQVTIPTEPTSPVTQNVTLSPLAIRVRVTNSRNNGAPVSGAIVHLFRSTQPNQSIANTTTDSQGIAVFPYQDHNLTTGTYEVESSRSGYRRVRKTNIQVTSTNQSVTVDVDMPWTLLTINVRNPQGQPVSGATVRVIRGGVVIREGTTP